MDGKTCIIAHRHSQPLSAKAQSTVFAKRGGKGDFLKQSNGDRWGGRFDGV